MNILIIGASTVEYNYSKLNLSQFDYVICCDGGLNYAKKNNIKVDLILGDFDSYSGNDLESYSNKVVYPKIKDYSDLELAIKKTLELDLNATITIINATGARLDHFISNINYLVKYNQNKIILLDNQNEIFTSLSNTFIKDEYDYISFYALHPNATICLKGFKYNLESYDLKEYDSLCLSNEIIDEAKLITNQMVLVIKSKQF